MVDLCLEATQVTGPVSLFIGIESSGWNAQEFSDAGQFAKQHGITCVFLKCFEVGSKEGDVWYGGMNGVDANINLIKAEGVACIPYGFLYGDTFGNLSKEIDVAKQLLSKYGVLCLDMEGAYWANQSSAGWASQLATALQSIPGQLWVSCVANPVDAGQLPFLQAMLPATNVFMPMVYSDYLSTKWESDFKQLGASCVQPTIDLSGEFGPNNVPAIVSQIVTSGVQALSMWEYQSAVQYASTLDQVMQAFSGNQGGGNVPLQLDSNGCVMTVTKSYQLMENEPDLCGPWSAMAVAFAYPPGGQPQVDNNTIDEDTDALVKAVFNELPANFKGVSPQDEFNILVYIRDHVRTIHFWVINPADIPLALKAGYLCLFSCNEADLEAWDKNSNSWVYPFPWHISAGHVLPVTGIDKNGNWICPDQLNNSFQGYWPVIYNAQKIQNSISWACMIQVVGPDATKPYLAPFPSGTPATWPQGFNAQKFEVPPPAPPPPAPPPPAQDYKAQAFAQEWTSIVPGLSTTSGIAKLAYADYWTDQFHGPATSKEFQLFQKDGSEKVAQTVLMGIYIWDLKTSTGVFYPYH